MKCILFVFIVSLLVECERTVLVQKYGLPTMGTVPIPIL